MSAWTITLEADSPAPGTRPWHEMDMAFWGELLTYIDESYPGTADNLWKTCPECGQQHYELWDDEAEELAALLTRDLHNGTIAAYQTQHDAEQAALGPTTKCLYCTDGTSPYGDHCRHCNATGQTPRTPRPFTTELVTAYTAFTTTSGGHHHENTPPHHHYWDN